MNVAYVLAAIAGSLIVSGAGCAWWGHHTLEPDYAYAGVLLIGPGLAFAVLAVAGLLLFSS